MANPIIPRTNLAEAATLSGSGFASTRPVTNAATRRLHQFARITSTSARALTLHADLGADAEAVRLVTAHNHNASARARARILASDIAARLPEPALRLDFLSGELDSRITFTRASTATYVDADGDVQTAAVDTPRFEHHPVTGARRGLLIEGASTNVNHVSEDTSTNNLDTGYARTNVDRTSADNASPIGDVATLFTASGGSGLHSVITRRSTLATPWHSVFPIWLKAGGTHRVQINQQADTVGHGAKVEVDLSAGTLGTPAVIGSGVVLGAWIERYRDGWFRVALAVDHTSAADGMNINSSLYLLDAGGNDTFTPAGTPESVYVAGWQVEKAAFPSSYIKTTGTAATRSADVATITGSNFTSWFKHGPGTVLLDQEVQQIALIAATESRAVTFSDGTPNNRLHFRFVTGTTAAAQYFDALVTTGGATEVNYTGTQGLDAAHPNTRIRAAVAFAGNDTAASFMGRSAATDTAVALPLGINQVNLAAGSNGTVWLRGLSYLASRLPNAQLEAWSNRGATINTDFTACAVDLPVEWTFTRSAGGEYESAEGVTSGLYDFVDAARAAVPGSQSFPVGAGLDLAVGELVDLVPQDATANVRMVGPVTAYTGAIATVDVRETGTDRTTTKTEWTMGHVGPRFDHDAGTALGVLLEATDTLTLEGDAFAARWRADAATVVVEGVAPATLSGTQTLLSLDDGSADERIEIVASAGALSAIVVDGGATQASLALGNLTAGTAFRVALAVKANDIAASLDGGAVVTDTGATLPTVTTLRLGKDYASADAWGGHVKRVILTAARETDADLVAMTTSGADLDDYTLPGQLADAADSPEVDTGWFDVWPGSYTPANTANHTPTLEKLFAADQPYRHWSLHIVDPAGPDADPPGIDDDLALELGYLGLWRCHQLGSQIEYGSTEPLASTSIVQTSDGGSVTVDVRPIARGRRVVFPRLSDTDRKALRNIILELDVAAPTYLILDPDATDGPEERFLARLQSLGAIEARSFRRFAAVFDLIRWIA